MSPQKVVAIVGTRPEAIKMAPVIKRMQADKRFQPIVCATGQHREMLYDLLEWFGIKPDIKMYVMHPGQPVAELASKILSNLQAIFSELRPDSVMVQGDTTSAFIASLAAFYNYDFNRSQPIKIAHIEAGLRTHEKYAPYPEEGNRRLIGHLADWHFAPTLTAAEALMNEGVVNNVFVTGNTVIDALLDTVAIVKKEKRNPLPFLSENQRLILVTGHRRENYGDGFRNICKALKQISKQFPHDAIVYPVHLNPNVRDVVLKELGDVANIHLIPPMNYPDFVAAMLRSYLILTDSGGIQEEAPSLGKPVLVLRDVTERPDAVAAGTVKLVGTDTNTIVREATKLLQDSTAYNAMAQAINPYGDGTASSQILNLMAGESSPAVRPTLGSIAA